mmetsp:Transcript_13268/g.29237  ORF Transcript_13268/g.29237 Transcript_13268/m.29237 type:complete len:369 (-) Transcript_13268:388-1494(-)
MVKRQLHAGHGRGRVGVRVGHVKLLGEGLSHGGQLREAVVHFYGAGVGVAQAAAAGEMGGGLVAGDEGVHADDELVLGAIDGHLEGGGALQEFVIEFVGLFCVELPFVAHRRFPSGRALHLLPLLPRSRRVVPLAEPEAALLRMREVVPTQKLQRQLLLRRILEQGRRREDGQLLGVAGPHLSHQIDGDDVGVPRLRGVPQHGPHHLLFQSRQGTQDRGPRRLSFFEARVERTSLHLRRRAGRGHLQLQLRGVPPPEEPDPGGVGLFRQGVFRNPVVELAHLHAIAIGGRGGEHRHVEPGAHNVRAEVEVERRGVGGCVAAPEGGEDDGVAAGGLAVGAVDGIVVVAGDHEGARPGLPFGVVVQQVIP